MQPPQKLPPTVKKGCDKKAEGIRQTRILQAEGEAEAIGLVNVIGDLSGASPLNKRNE